MASGSALSTARGGQIYVWSEFRDSLSLLDVLHADQFGEESLDPAITEETQENFYKGAPPNWLNFYISELDEFYGDRLGFIQRDGFETVKRQVQQKRKLPAISTVKLFHQPGSGGTTMAMQVLWDLRKTFRCAVLTDVTSDITKVAKEVVHLFTAGSRGHQNSVLLLVNDEQILDKLQDSIMKTIAEQNIVTYMPVVIFLNCVRKDVLLQSDHVVLQKVLSDVEKQKFDVKKKELIARYGEKINQFHGFNIIQSNFSEAYIKRACTVFSSVQKTKRPLKNQLAAYLSLLNAYVPGSYLLESQCLDFLKHDEYVYGEKPVEELMKPFGHLIITFQQDVRSERKVRMAHSMIAKCCTEFMAAAGVTRSDTARNFLNNFCKYEEIDEFPQCVLGFVKDMLTKRGTKSEEKPINSSDNKEDQERFSRLILDIQKMEDSKQCASVLKVASKKFYQNPFFPQALARFYYIELKDYNQAEIWATRAKQRDPQNSFVADTLGQVHKNHLKSKGISAKPREILHLSKKAIEAFKHEEQLSEVQQETRVSNIFNTRGLFGFLQVCNILYDILVCQNKIWREVLTQTVSLYSVLETLGDSKLFRFNDLIKSLKAEVERKCGFFDKYLTYSKLNIEKDDPEYISKDTLDCHRKYVGDTPPKHVKQKIAERMQKLKQNLADTSAGVLACLDREHTESDLKEITTCWEEICSSKDPGIATVNYIFAHIMLMNTGVTSPSKRKPFTTFREKIPLTLNDPPEQHMLALLLYWPSESEDDCIFDLSQLIHQMHCSFEHAYKRHFRSRYLRPLFFLGKGQDLNRIVHRKVLEMLFYKTSQETKPDWSNNWRNENIFKDSTVQACLLKVKGVVQNYRVYASVGGSEIEVEANLQRSLWKQRQVSFYLGFTIRGPVAFGIQTKTEDKGPSAGPLEACKEKDSNGWTKLQPEVKSTHRVQTYRLQSQRGHYECRVSALRWVCKDRFSFRYHHSSWEEHMSEEISMQYLPAGPLLNITVTAGKIEEVHLPHWICIDKDVPPSDMFAVLHVDTCGNYVEPVSEVTSAHVKLLQPDFSPRGVMVLKKLGFHYKVFRDVLIYKKYSTNRATLKLHVYVVPSDDHIKKSVKDEEVSDGFREIRIYSPSKRLELENHYFLTTNSNSAQINPKKRLVTCAKTNYSTDFFEVVIKEAASEFSLTLEGERKKNKVWDCTIQPDEYQNESIYHEQVSGQHFVDRHWTQLVKRVSNTNEILDNLWQTEAISPECYSRIRTLKTPQEQMREILQIVKAQGREDDFLKILRDMPCLRFLMSELDASQ